MQAKSKATSTPAARRTSAPTRSAAGKVDAAAAKPVKSKPAADSAADAAAKPHVKLVRDSFTMPREDFDLIAQLKARALDFKRPAKKSELLRAGLQALAALPDVQLHAALDALRPLKAGRPKHNH